MKSFKIKSEIILDIARNGDCYLMAGRADKKLINAIEMVLGILRICL
jgi:hypothetical protein